MSFFSNYLKGIVRTFDSKGRSSRSEYWTFISVNTAIILALVLLGVFMENSTLYWIGLGFAALTLTSSISLLYRRLHDTGRRGYFFLISFIPPFGVIGLILALVEPGESYENEFGPVTDAAKAEIAAKSKAELSLKDQLKRSVKPVETAIRVNLFSFAIISVLVTIGIIFILSTDSGNFFYDMALYNRNKDLQFTELRLYYDKDGVQLDELEMTYLDVELDPQRMALATREPELILDQGDLKLTDLKFHYPVELFLPSNVMGQMRLDMSAIDGFLAEADAIATQMQFDESFREEFIVKRGIYDSALANFEEKYNISLEEAHTGLVEVPAAKINFEFWGRQRSGALMEASIIHDEPGFGDYAFAIWDFLTGLEWQPMIGKFGILPLLNSTLMTSFIAMLVAAPLGLFVAIYLSEYASERIRSTLKPILEILAGIPTVVYGYFAVTFMTPLLQSIFGNDVVDFYNTASAGLVMGILILPLVSSMAEDAISAVPLSLRQAAYGLGATKLETSINVVVPAAISGLSAAFIVGLSRAIGETMIVALAAGAGPRLTANPFEGAETMTGYIVRISSGDVSYQSIDYDSIFSIGLVLFLVTLVLNFISRGIVKRFRETYE